MALKDTIIRFIPRKLPKFTFFRCVLYFILLCIFPPTRAIIVDILLWALKQWLYYVLLPIGQWAVNYFIKTHRTSIIDTLVTDIHTSITEYRDDAIKDKLLDIEDDLMQYLTIPVEFARRLNVVLAAMTEARGYKQLVNAKERYEEDIDTVLRSTLAGIGYIPKDLLGTNMFKCKSFLYESVDYVRRSQFIAIMRNNFGLLPKLEGHFLHAVSVKKNFKVFDDIYGKGQLSNVDVIGTMVDASQLTTQAIKSLALDFGDAMSNFVVCMGNKRLPPILVAKSKYKV